MTPERNAVVLLSGGLDSATTLAIAARQGFAVHALTVHYGQRNDIEIRSAQRIAEAFNVHSHKTVELDLRAFGGSALTGDIDVPHDRSADDIAHGVPITYVPARNTLFLSMALAWAEVLGAQDIFIGVNAVDYSGYPDCRPEFIKAFQRLARLATKAGAEDHRPLTIHTPLIQLTKAKIIARGIELGVDYAMTHSCYDPQSEGAACGSCDACILRRKGFLEAGVPDPTNYHFAANADPIAKPR